MNKKYKAVLFDMDGVIVDSMKWHAASWIEVFAGHGVIISEEEIYKREGMSGLDSIIDVLKSAGAPVPDRAAQKRLLEKKLEIFEKHTIPVFPCVREILDYLSLKKIKLGLVTGSLRRSVNHVLPRNILQFFDIVITADDIKRGKPHPEPYLAAVAKTGFGAAEALVIENAPLGIESAKSAGLDCLALQTTLPKEYLSAADAVFKDHRALYSYLKNVFE